MKRTTGPRDEGSDGIKFRLKTEKTKHNSHDPNSAVNGTTKHAPEDEPREAIRKAVAHTGDGGAEETNNQDIFPSTPTGIRRLAP